MSELSNTTAPPGRRGDSYDDLEPRFDELAALADTDPRRAVVREQIIRLSLPLADHIAHRFRGRGVDDDDLRQVACVGLVGAVDRFDPARGSSFLSFAIPTIMGEIRRYFRDQSWAVRVPRRVKEVHALIGPAVEELAQRLGRMPRPSEIAADLELDQVDIAQALVAGNCYRSDSLDAVFRDDDGYNSAAARLGDEEPRFGVLEDAMAVRPLLAALSAQEQQVLVWRFADDLSQSEIADRLGASQMHVSRMLSRILARLRAQAA